MDEIHACTHQIDLRVGGPPAPFFTEKSCDWHFPKIQQRMAAAALLRQPSAVCSCRTHGQSCVLRLRGRPLNLVLPTRLQLWFFTWNNPPAARRATGVQRASKPGPATCEARRPTRPDSYFPRVTWYWVKSLMASKSRVSAQGRCRTSKFKRVGALRHGRCTHPTGRRGAGQGCRNLLLNSLNEPATQRGSTFDRMSTLP